MGAPLAKSERTVQAMSRIDYKYLGFYCIYINGILSTILIEPCLIYSIFFVSTRLDRNFRIVYVEGRDEISECIFPRLVYLSV